MDKNYKEHILKILENHTKNMTSSPQKAKEYLYEIGIYDEDGNINENYRQSKINNQ